MLTLAPSPPPNMHDNDEPGHRAVMLLTLSLTMRLAYAGSEGGQGAEPK